LSADIKGSTELMRSARGVVTDLQYGVALSPAVTLIFLPLEDCALTKRASNTSAGFVAASDTAPGARDVSACSNGVTDWPAAANAAWMVFNVASDGAWSATISGY
jgi:hypothetical protein